MSDTSFRKGKKCEDIVLRYFTHLNYKLILRNSKIFKVEIDFLLKKKDTFYFVEVKSNHTWRVEDLLSRNQKERLIETASSFSSIYQVSTRLILAVVHHNCEIDTYPLDGEIEVEY